MPNLYTIPAGAPIADHTATHVLATLEPLALSRAVILVPNRRSCVVMRHALMNALNGKTSLLPRILPLADTDAGILSMLGAQALPLIADIPPAMHDAEHRYLLAQQIRVFEQWRSGGVSLHYALTLADTLMALQEHCTRHGVVMTQEKLRPLFHADIATHWKQALQFLGILTDSWPALEAELGMATQAAREVALMQALATHWASTPPDFSVIAVGSTASQPATAQLLKAIADMPLGQVILPGLDPRMEQKEWESVVPGHPLHHLKSLLDLWPMSPAQVQPLTNVPRSAWLDILVPTAQIPQWREQSAMPDTQHLRLISCAHAEEEVRVVTLLLRESLEQENARVVLITPDEGLMARVAVQMKRYDIHVDRLNAGTLATTESGSLWAALMAAILAPERMLTIRSLLHHPLLAIDAALLSVLERGWHGVNRTRAGQLPRHDASLKSHSQFAMIENLLHSINRLSGLSLSASAWVEEGEALLAPWVKSVGKGQDAVAEQLDLLSHAEHFGALDAEEFSALLSERLATKWRDVGLNTEPRIAMLTPVEARLEHFDRVILANMQDALWPGTTPPNPWLNLAAQAALGLPAPEDAISRMAHDVLMLASSGEVFLTYPRRDAGSPTARSRFIERLVTLLAAHGIEEHEITASHYIDWANAREASATYEPEREIFPRPVPAQRPRRMQVTDIDKLFSDPFSIYAKYVLGLRKLDAIDASPEASDFGSLTHKAIEQLTRHWTHEQRPASEAELTHIANHALRDFSDRPNVDLFWRTRLMNGLTYVNGLERQRRTDILAVASEETIEAVLGEVTLYGRIDRVEQHPQASVIVDYKTGKAPSKKEIADGRALQLLTYAMLVRERDSATPLAAIEYWALPRIGTQGDITRIEDAAMNLDDMAQKLREAFSHMLAPDTPFLATGRDERFGNDYDGISRYDEWAG